MSRLLLISLPQKIARPLLLSLIISSSLSLLTLVVYFPLQPAIPIFYTQSHHHLFLAAKQWIFLFPILSFSLTCFHLLLIKKLQFIETVLLASFAWTTVALQLLLSLALIRILILIM